jgi:hypothetical protein
MVSSSHLNHFGFQSFFFYVLPATDRYVSIGLYMRPLAMIVVPLVVQAFSLWINAGMIEPIPELKVPIINSRQKYPTFQN